MAFDNKEGQRTLTASSLRTINNLHGFILLTHLHQTRTIPSNYFVCSTFMCVNVVQGLLEKELNACRLSHAIQLEGRHSLIVFLTVMPKWD